LHRVPPDQWPAEIRTIIRNNVIEDSETNTNNRGHRRLFRIAQALKGIPQLANEQPENLGPIIAEWQRQSNATIQSLTLDDLIAAFADAWDQVKNPGGELRDALNSAMEKPLPPPAQQEPLPTGQNLLALMYELSRRAQGESFRMDQRSAGSALGVSHKTVGRCIREFRRKNLVELVQQGQRNRASYYRIVDEWGDADDEIPI
jgi:hypothetical protein